MKNLGSRIFEYLGSGVRVKTPAELVGRISWDWVFGGRPRFRSLVQAGGARNLASDITYAPFGPLTGLTLGNGIVLDKIFGVRVKTPAELVGRISWDWVFGDMGIRGQATVSLPGPGRRHAPLGKHGKGVGDQARSFDYNANGDINRVADILLAYGDHDRVIRAQEYLGSE
jgi:hypothetical protein